MNETTYKITTYRADHRDGVIALWRQVFAGGPRWNDPATDIDRKATVRDELFLVAVTGDQVMATVMGGFDGHRGWIYYLAVHPEHRERGVARALMQSAEARLAAMGCPKVNLQVRSSNPGVVAFYQKLGYQVEERVSMGKLL
jgi:hypothetical protein